ncbi:hypothetical protein A3A69_01195 [candidate division WWE3 bacterium RIFCSPLOWO2_01_FULL_37_15]|uniref:OmpR/PhoB-type domain-containing protein n=1 Tax=candidate division WWE3 bacterium RIFCSPLOWO2_01_FULL_37_15 TaxID=1802622 RepID=A0A1F4UT76_UNCKA|nr:MAG: hypothetical protein A3A69_01195 [candidate division WWE3 bacterium RIFCSPLOWO2_01_FULL_37_15]
MKKVTKWNYNTRNEAERVIASICPALNGFYKNHGFYIIPHTNEYSKKAFGVILPNLPYNKYPRFWEKITRYNYSPFNINTDENLIDFVELELKKISVDEPNYFNLKQDWDRFGNYILTSLYDFLGLPPDFLTEINIYPTRYGTGTSFRVAKKIENIAKINLREGCSVLNITSSLVSILSRPNINHNLQATWEEATSITDWIMTESTFAKKLFEITNLKYNSMIKYTRSSSQPKLIKESAEYCKVLGIPSTFFDFKATGNSIIINDKTIDFTPNEMRMLKLFIEKRGCIVKIQEIADELYKNDNNFSLYAISKNIQRIRDKFEANGISSSYIQSSWGVGYMLRL